MGQADVKVGWPKILSGGGVPALSGPWGDRGEVSTGVGRLSEAPRAVLYASAGSRGLGLLPICWQAGGGLLREIGSDSVRGCWSQVVPGGRTGRWGVYPSTHSTLRQLWSR